MRLDGFVNLDVVSKNLLRCAGGFVSGLSGLIYLERSPRPHCGRGAGGEGVCIALGLYG